MRMKLPDTYNQHGAISAVSRRKVSQRQQTYIAKRCDSPILFQADQGLLEGPIISRQNLQILCEERALRAPQFTQPRPESRTCTCCPILRCCAGTYVSS